jgi:hypothetical protein
MGDDSQRLRKRGRIVLIGFMAVAAFYLITEHTAHFLGVLPYAIFLACPLMHLFMHHGHRGHRHGKSEARMPAGEAGLVAGEKP